MVFVGYLMVCGIVGDPFSVPYFRSTFFVIIFVVDSRFQNRSFYQIAPYNARCYNENMSHQFFFFFFFSVNLGFIIDNETLTFCICYYVIDILSAMINRLRDKSITMRQFRRYRAFFRSSRLFFYDLDKLFLSGMVVTRMLVLH